MNYAMFYVTVYGPSGVVFGEAEFDVFDWLSTVTDFGWSIVGQNGDDRIVFMSPANPKHVLLMVVES